MFPAQIRLLGVTLESIFPKAVLYSKMNIEQISERLMERFSMQGLLPESLLLNKPNELFDYDLKFSLFRGSAEFSLNSRRLKMNFVDAIKAADISTIVETAAACHQCILPLEGTNHFVMGYAHFAFESAEDFKTFFSTKGTKWENEFISAGIIAHIAEPGWSEPIHTSVDHSILIEGGGYIVWNTHFSAALVTTDILSKVVQVFEQAALQCQLKFLPLP
jgi:hypothetical protein